MISHPQKMTTTGTLKGAVTALAVGLVLTLPTPGANATSTRVPPWPTGVTGAIPTSIQAPATTTSEDYLATMRKRLNRRLGLDALGSNVSVRVEDLASGTVEFAHRSNVGMIPASTQKTATALAALSAVGPDHLMPTVVRLNEDVGTITVVGGGDALLSSANLDELAQRVAERLSGDRDQKYDVTYDDSLFAAPQSPRGWMPSYYTAYASRPTALTRDLAPVADPSADAAKFFRKRLKSKGVPVNPGASRGSAGQGSTEIARFAGHTMAEVLSPMLTYSDNSIAENVIRHVALARGSATTAGAAAQAVRDELAELDIAMRSFSPADGSGLSRADRVTTKTLVSITRAAVDPRDPRLATGFRTSSYPIAGKTGTLGSRFRDRATSCAAGRIMAKTGTLSDVVALSGITSSTDGKLRAFAIVVNNKPSWASIDATRAGVDRIATAITGCR